MPPTELAHLELRAEVDSLVAQLRAWSDRAPHWLPAQHCAALVHQLIERSDSVRVRLHAPLVVATLGGTGTGKSTLVNALVGADVTEAGRERPTTLRPTLICHERCSPELFGFRADELNVVARDLPALHDLVLLDCPDPDTTEDQSASGTNLARLRRQLPHCDVLLVTSTQQKYRSARVLAELATAVPGARLVFVQTHADTSDDIREDWRSMLAEDYQVGEMFFVDSVAALEDARSGIEPRGEFARLTSFLSRELASTAAHRIRRANFLDLVKDTLESCQAQMVGIDRLEDALTEQRARISSRFTRALRDELLTSQRPWENRLLGEVTRRWGFSPFALVLRAYQGLGGIVSSLALMRARTPAQMALWGAFEGGRVLRRQQQHRRAGHSVSRAATLTLDQDDLRTAAIILDGYASDVGLTTATIDIDELSRESQQASAAFVTTASTELDRSVSGLAARHTGRITRFRYELLLGALLGLLLFRLGKNFFWDSWLASPPTPILGLEFFVAAGVILWLWCTVLVWAFTRRLRRGLQVEVAALAERCATSTAMTRLFSRVERECRAVRRFQSDLEHLELSVGALKARIEQPETRLGHRLERVRPLKHETTQRAIQAGQGTGD